MFDNQYMNIALSEAKKAYDKVIKEGIAAEIDANPDCIGKEEALDKVEDFYSLLERTRTYEDGELVSETLDPA